MALAMAASARIGAPAAAPVGQRSALSGRALTSARPAPLQRRRTASFAVSAKAGSVSFDLREYTVRPYDTINSIAKRFNVDVEFVESMNPQLRTNPAINRGDVIKVPVFKTSGSPAPAAAAKRDEERRKAEQAEQEKAAKAKAVAAKKDEELRKAEQEKAAKAKAVAAKKDEELRKAEKAEQEKAAKAKAVAAKKVEERRKAEKAEQEKAAKAKAKSSAAVSSAPRGPALGVGVSAPLMSAVVFAAAAAASATFGMGLIGKPGAVAVDSPEGDTWHEGGGEEEEEVEEDAVRRNSGAPYGFDKHATKASGGGNAAKVNSAAADYARKASEASERNRQEAMYRRAEELAADTAAREAAEAEAAAAGRPFSKREVPYGMERHHARKDEGGEA